MKRPSWLLSTSDDNLFHPAYWFGGADARPLGIFRIAFAALMLKEALYHLFVAEIWYSDAGMMPAHLLRRMAPTTPSLMSFLPETGMTMVFFGMWALVALLLLLGWQTRLMTVFNFVLLVSVINRNPLVVTGADSVMQALAFWSLCLPLGRWYSLDARRQRATPSNRIFAFPLRMIQVQIALIYIFTTIFKLHGETWQNGDALYMALQVRMHTFPIAEWLLANASLDLLRALTYLALILEGAFALLVFAPILQPYLRTVGLAGGIVLHLGIGVVMNVPNFPLVMLTSYLLLIDPRWLDWAAPKYALIPPNDAAKAGAGCRATLTGIPAALGKGAYRGVSVLMLASVMGFVIWSNILSDDRLAIQLNVPAIPRPVEDVMRATGLWQSWGMFAPNPLGFEGWFGLNGIFPDGFARDIRSATGRPRYYVGPLARWGKLEENLMMRDKDDPVFIAWAAYLCQQVRGTGMVGVEIVLYSRLTSPPGQPFLPYQMSVIRGANCIG